MNDQGEGAIPKPKQNELMFQAFEWNVPADHQHWNRLAEGLVSLKEIGVTSIWIPPGCKAIESTCNGYGVYDLYDIGEFDQKGSVPTKWGSKKELQALVKSAYEMDIRILWDAVLNHKAGADKTEKCLATRVHPNNRNHELDKPPKLIEAWLGFTFPGRGNVYSSMKYHWEHFSGIDQDLFTGLKGIFKIVGDNKNCKKSWAPDVSKENGNYDYLMFADVDFSHKDVRDDVKNWIQWLRCQMPIGGLRLDAVKHYSRSFLLEFLVHIKDRVGPDWFFAAEYWSPEVDDLLCYLKNMKNLVALFDVPLVHNISKISQKERADLRKIFKKTLVSKRPDSAVTFVMNHDTLPVDWWFKPLAYALILLRKDGVPCVFYGDLHGINETPLNAAEPPVTNLGSLVLARTLYAYGSQRDYFNQKHCLGFVRSGSEDHPSGLACIMSNAGRAFKFMYVGMKHAGEAWTEVYGEYGGTVKINCMGYGRFGVMGKSVSVWVNSEAKGRERFSGLKRITF
ncbi:alpha-amylase [Emydomyces testavorans]|uniref:Alpha-amylase n=1 Tax=Emydomyces testavorans TaxID=2070801 RepID=A0AAF0DAF6_9EURO|nr:alpha-amylase [Emydomyces testavorans]